MSKSPELPVIESDVEDVNAFLIEEIEGILALETLPDGLNREAFIQWLLDSEEADYFESWHVSLSLRPLELERDVCERVRVQVADYSQLFGRDEICRTRLVNKVQRFKSSLGDLEVAVDNMLKSGDVIVLGKDGFVEEAPSASIPMAFTQSSSANNGIGRFPTF